MSAAIRSHQQLGSKEESLFKQIVKHYEAKMYKKGIKTADQILKKYPDHGETLAMKALLVHNSGDKRDEAHQLAHAALRADISSYVCWHVYGILHRADRNYTQAVKCYVNALQRDPNNLNICRDLAVLQMQLRDIPGLVDTAQRILAFKPGARNHWMMLAIAHHLNNSHSTAVEVLNTFMSIQDNPMPEDSLDKVELGEIELYKATILVEAGDLQGAHATLHSAKYICDRLSQLTMQARIALGLADYDTAVRKYRELVSTIPDNYNYHKGLLAALRLPDPQEMPSDDVLAELKRVYVGLAAEFPTSSAARRIPLDFLSGEEFQEAVQKHIREFVDRGVPSLFSDLRPLLARSDKDAAIWTAASEMLTAAEPGSPTALWLHLYLAQHAAHTRRFQLAVEHIETARTSPAIQVGACEVFAARADILADVGDLPGAASAADVARRLDLQDRYVNSMAVKHMFRAGHVEEAAATALLFARDLDEGVNNLFEMQAMWYELECGRAHFKRGDLGMALKMFNRTLTHFADITEDQFDFHMYCLRKVTLRAYLDMLKMEDRLYSQPNYADAACGAVSVYVRLHDAPPGRAQQLADQERMATMSEAQKRRFMEKRNKEVAKAARVAAEKLEKERAAHNARRNAGRFDEDPEGKKLLECKDPLEAAASLVSVLKQHASHLMQTHQAALDVALRQQRPFLALHAVKQIQHIDADVPEAHSALLRLTHWLSQRTHGVTDKVALEVLEEELSALTGGKSSMELNEAFLASAGDRTLTHRLVAAQMRYLLEPSDVGAAVALVCGCDLEAVPNSVFECVEVHEWLTSLPEAPDAASQFYQCARKQHKWSVYFDGESRLEALDVHGIVQGIGSQAESRT